MGVTPDAGDGGSTATTAIESVGTTVPRGRITAETIEEAWDGFRARGIEEKRVPAADEDAVTMAVAAATDALADSAFDRADVATLALGTTTPPVDEGDVGATVAEILGLDHGIETAVHAQSTRAGTRALVDGLRANRPALVVAADCPRSDPDDAVDHGAGAGAVAFVLADGAADGDGGEADGAADGDGGDVEGGDATIVDVAAYTDEFAGTRFRNRGEESVETYGATAYTRTAYTSVVSAAFEGIDVRGMQPAAIAPTATNGSLPGRAGRAVGDVDVHHMATTLGDTGAASPLFGLLAAWDDGRESVAVVGYGDGASADAIAVEGRLPVDLDWPSTELTYAEYLRKRGHVVGGGGD